MDVKSGPHQYRSRNEGSAVPPSRTAAETVSGTRKGHVGAAYVRVVRLDCSEMMVEKELWVGTKGDPGREKADVLRIDTRVALLNECNDSLERECQELIETVTTMGLMTKNETNDNQQFVFRSGSYHHSKVHTVDDLNCIFKEEGVQLTFPPCFIELQTRMFHLSKRTATETPVLPENGL